MDSWIATNLLTLVTFMPAAGAVLLLFMRRSRPQSIRTAALLVSLVTLVLSLGLAIGFDSKAPGFQFKIDSDWIPSMGVHYQMGIDGVSIFLILLATVLTPLAILASSSIADRVQEYFIFMLLLETGMVGVFGALDLFLFYVFWEVVLVPMYFLIGVWGGERRIYATMKFVLYTMVGSVLMLISIVAIYVLHGQTTGDFTFSYPVILNALATGKLQFGAWEMPLFLAFFLAFAVKVPLFPFHTWLPDAHVEAPTAGSVLLAGVLLKMGTYGLIRFSLPLFPAASHWAAPMISTLAVIGIIYGALVAMVQPDMKKLVAYSSVSHMGFIVLGIFSFSFQGIQGAIYQMLNHGVSTGALFLLVGVIYERRHTRQIDRFGGLAHPMPVYAVFFLIVTFSSIGLPGLNGFVGEFLILLGTFQTHQAHAVFAATGVILSAVYMLWMVQRVMWGAVTHEENRSLRDLNGREWMAIGPLLILIVWMGIYSNHFLRPMDSAVTSLIQRIDNEKNNSRYAAAKNSSNPDPLTQPSPKGEGFIPEIALPQEERGSRFAQPGPMKHAPQP